ncbi:hypothetical protein BGZ60DRAFT_165252 [Tricladium varicosporioides]|nr:hypothetical protein BGZ60DRAFT_165252 [Hymenoscyphus varicosporioides]
MPSMNSAAFNNPAVTNSANPSTFGWHHGPIPNNNPGWIPVRQRAAAAAGTQPPAVTTADNANPPIPAVNLSSINNEVCQIDMGGGTMCGVVFGNQPSLRRHLRNVHPGAITNPTRTNTSVQETAAGQSALKLFVLSGGWRNADFAVEPGRGPPGGYMDRYATACEAIARTDAAFRATYGSEFHRVKRVIQKAKKRRFRFYPDPFAETENITTVSESPPAQDEHTQTTNPAQPQPTQLDRSQPV